VTATRSVVAMCGRYVTPEVDDEKREFLMLDMPEGSTILGNPNPEWWKQNRDTVETRFTEWQAG